jgi:hypothetical protein
VVNTLAEAGFVRIILPRAANVPLKCHFPTINLIVNPLARVLLAIQLEVVEERSDSVVWNARVGEPVILELRGAAVQADVAVTAGESALRGRAVELDGEGEVQLAVGVVFVVVCWVAEVAGSG